MLYLVCYDIEHNRTRKKVADCLEKHGLDRVQYSVFLGVLTQARKRSLALQLDKLVHGRNNATVSLIALKTFDVGLSCQFGDKPVDWAYFENKKTTLIF